MECQNCGRKLLTDWEKKRGVCDPCYNVKHECRVCGRKLVNEWEIEHGVCAGCEYNEEHGTITTPRDGIAKYIRALSVCRTVSIILAIIAVVAGCFGGFVGVIIGIFGALGFIGMAVLFGALREILQQL